MTTPDYKGHKNLADMILPHIENWRDCLKMSREWANTQDNKLFIDHELKALDEIECAAEKELGL